MRFLLPKPANTAVIDADNPAPRHIAGKLTAITATVIIAAVVPAIIVAVIVSTVVTIAITVGVITLVTSTAISALSVYNQTAFHFPAIPLTINVTDLGHIGKPVSGAACVTLYSVNTALYGTAAIAPAVVIALVMSRTAIVIAVTVTVT